MENEQADAGRDDAEPVSRDQILRRERGQGNNVHFSCSADDHEQDWQTYPVVCDDHTYYIEERGNGLGKLLSHTEA